jgi:hypothetical protein
MVQFFAANGAGVIDCQIPAKQWPATTFGAFALPSLSHRGQRRAFPFAFTLVGHTEHLFLYAA